MISEDSPTRADQFIRKIFDVTEKLVDFPRIGRQVPEADDTAEEIRELLFHDYRIIHRVNTEAHIQVLTVMHGSRDLASAKKHW